MTTYAPGITKTFTSTWSNPADLIQNGGVRMTDPISSTTLRTPPSLGPAATDARETALRKQAEQLESLLFAQLLSVSGTGSPSPAGGGETQFDSFLRQAQADAVSQSGQTGLAEAIYRSLAKRV